MSGPAIPPPVSGDPERPFTVMILNPMGGDGWGGVERWFMDVGTGLRDRGHRIVSVGRPGSLWTERSLEQGFETRSTDMRGDLAWGEARMIAQYMMDTGTEVVCTKLHRGIRLGGLAARMAGHVPVVAFMGLVEVKKGLRYRLTYKAFLHWILTLAPSMRDDILAVGGMPEDRVVAIPYGIVPEKWDTTAEDRARVRAEWGVGDDEVLLLGVGRLHEQKRFDRMLEAFAELRQRRPEARLAIVGTGSLGPSIERRAAELGVADAVIMAGFRADTPAVFAAGDVFFLSSDDEGLPMVVIEAMASGLPVVATEVGAMRDLIADGESGVVVPRLEAADLAAAVEPLVADADLRRRMGDAGRARIREHYPLTKCVERTESFLLEVAGRIPG